MHLRNTIRRTCPRPWTRSNRLNAKCSLYKGRRRCRSHTVIGWSLPAGRVSASSIRLRIYLAAGPDKRGFETTLVECDGGWRHVLEIPSLQNEPFAQFGQHESAPQNRLCFPS